MILSHYARRCHANYCLSDTRPPTAVMLAFPVVSIVAIRVGLLHQRPVANFPLAHAWQSPAVTLSAAQGQTGQRPAQALARPVPDGGMGRILLAGVATARLCAMLPAGVAPLLPGRVAPPPPPSTLRRNFWVLLSGVFSPL